MNTNICLEITIIIFKENENERKEILLMINEYQLSNYIP